MASQSFIDAVNRLAKAVEGLPPKPTGVREEELELDRRVGSAVRQLAKRGVDTFGLKRAGVGWVVRAKTGDEQYSVVTTDYKSMVDALEYAARNWPR